MIRKRSRAIREELVRMTEQKRHENQEQQYRAKDPEPGRPRVGVLGSWQSGLFHRCIFHL